MEIGVISDIHANLPALNSVLSALSERGIEHIICAGDIVGYYGSPNAVIKKLNNYDIRAVRGNHDDAVLTGSAYSLNDSARLTVDWTRQMVSDKAHDYLESLPIARTDKIGETIIYATHGSSRSPLTEYVYEEDIDQRYVEDNFTYPPDIVVHGHTHRPYVTETDTTVFVNPGSVGQPRDGKSSASYAIIDTKFETAARYRVEYDIEKTVSRLRNRGLPPKLGQRLFEGQ